MGAGGRGVDQVISRVAYELTVLKGLGRGVLGLMVVCCTTLERFWTNISCAPDICHIHIDDRLKRLLAVGSCDRVLYRP